MSWLALIIGSTAGGISRYLLGSAVHHAFSSEFPLGTLVVNATGCLIVGFLSSAGGARFNLNHEARLLLVTGFCGAFTTFSAFILESEALYRNGSAASAALYVGVTLALGFGFFLVGSVVGRLI